MIYGGRYIPESQMISQRQGKVQSLAAAPKSMDAVEYLQMLFPDPSSHEDL